MDYKTLEVRGNTYKIYYEGVIKSPKGIILKPMDNGNGYMYVSLGKGTDGYSHFYVHILVCTLFHPNPNRLPEVNHKDGIKHNNHRDNLEWTDRLGNVRDYIAKGRARFNLGKVVSQYSTEGILIASYKNCREAARLIGCTAENIRMAANPNNAAKTASGFVWKYKTNEL